jgi:hypothetical protein
MTKTVSKEQMSKLPYIIAIDFDGMLVEDKYPRVGRGNGYVFKRALEAKSNGAKLILWTCRNGVLLDEAVRYCRYLGLEFDAINRNIDEVITMFDSDTRKVYADEYWDDKNVMLDPLF